ncbi:helix-hairpin-helix domain-containing protein [Algoriphagus sp.]|uniref:ComEA family DNA-binding protein n=1 Tax=Algoriphagus sp. TaxID=1872435 RepID=UPI002726B4DA|nr:helix-hairpin-helix domain-containing protein [Algoriphagus sp.]MDO8967591.1 helix-hairpin-helix domain-containing protein [Algoriphagus sp.]MDP3198608.1 helix-hairpin-helix domain-containing protein [Algoriphagus sp.]
MKETIFYWMKSYLGFSRKESKGFVLLIPFLVVFGFVPIGIGFFKNQQAEQAFDRYQLQLDSLKTLGVQLKTSPLPTFNPNDTAKTTRNQKQINNLNRIPFSEADSVMLQIVPGIGQATAGRIIKYRENLGGFHSKSQLGEVFGVKTETAEAVWDFFEFDPRIFKKLKINAASLEELAAHPYISYGEAKVLIAFRTQHGKFNSSDDLLKIKIFKTEWVQKIKPYLSFE